MRRLVSIALVLLTLVGCRGCADAADRTIVGLETGYCASYGCCRCADSCEVDAGERSER